jgi:hypothetical protein
MSSARQSTGSGGLRRRLDVGHADPLIHIQGHLIDHRDDHKHARPAQAGILSEAQDRHLLPLIRNLKMANMKYKPTAREPIANAGRFHCAPAGEPAVPYLWPGVLSFGY